MKGQRNRIFTSFFCRLFHRAYLLSKSLIFYRVFHFTLYLLSPEEAIIVSLITHQCRYQANYNSDFWEKQIQCIMEDSIEDNRFAQKISSMKQAAGKGSKYSVPLPFRNNDPIPNNRANVENRMK